MTEYLVYDDAEDKRGGDRGYRDCAEVERKTADAADEYSRDDKEVSVLLEVDLLDHLKTRYGDEAVERDAYAAHYAARNRVDERNEGREEGNDYREDGGCDYGRDGGVAGDGYAGYGFAVGGVGAAASRSE